MQAVRTPFDRHTTVRGLESPEAGWSGDIGNDDEEFRGKIFENRISLFVLMDGGPFSGFLWNSIKCFIIPPPKKLLQEKATSSQEA